MKVKELIETLKQIPEEAEVSVYTTTTYGPIYEEGDDGISSRMFPMIGLKELGNYNRGNSIKHKKSFGIELKETPHTQRYDGQAATIDLHMEWDNPNRK